MFTFKKSRSIFILLVVFIFLLSSASFSAKTNTDDSANILVYEEQTIGKGFINNPVSFIRLNSKNQLVVYDSGNYCFLNLNGEPARQIKPDFTGSGHIFALDSKDNLYVLAQETVVDNSVQNMKRKLYIYSPKGEKLKTLDLGNAAIKDGQPNFIYDMAVDSKGNVYLVVENEGLAVVGKDAKSIKSYRSGVYYGIVIDREDNLIVYGFTANTQFVEKIKRVNGETVWKINTNSGTGISHIYYNAADKCIYALGQKRVAKYDASGKLSGVVFDLYQNDLINEKIEIRGFAVDPFKDIFMIISQIEEEKGLIKTLGSSVKKFIPVSGAKRDKNQKVITIAVAKSWSNLLEKAGLAFEKKYPGYKVNIKEYYSDYTPEAQERYQKTINTEILAGKGADIIEVSGLPYKRYIDKNIFVDLSDQIANGADIDRRIFNACKYKGGKYLIPIDLSIWPLYANQTILDREGIKIDDTKWSWRDFLDIAQKVTKDTDNDGIIDQYALTKMDERTLFWFFYRNATDQFIDYDRKSAQFDTPEFQDLLLLCESFTAKKVVNPQVDPQEFFQGQGQSAIAFISANFSGYASLIYLRERIFHDNINVLSFPGTGGSIGWSASGIYVINKNSPYKKEAWEFVKILLSEELQKSNEISGFAINLKAREGQVVYAMETIRDFIGIPVIQKLTGDQRKMIDGLLSRIGELQYNDFQVTQIINDEVSKYFAGEKTAEETGKVIQNKVNTYLNE